MAMSRQTYPTQAISQNIKELKTQQEKCTQVLLECIATRDEYPQYAERIDLVISSIEAVMSQNADRLARLEAEARSTTWYWNAGTTARASI
jgi:Trp operon repressor